MSTVSRMNVYDCSVSEFDPCPIYALWLCSSQGTRHIHDHTENRVQININVLNLKKKLPKRPLTSPPFPQQRENPKLEMETVN